MREKPKVKISVLEMQRQNLMDTWSRVEPKTLIETMRSLRIEVQSYKEDNEKMMKEQNQINSQMMQILNQLQRQAKNGSGSRQGEEGRQHERRDNYRRASHSRRVVELIDITHLLTQLGSLMHLRIQGEVQKCLLLGSKKKT
jgi:hypothetical protein